MLIVKNIQLIISYWKNLTTHKKVWALALPIILSNLSVPLVALVDTMVIGRLPDAYNMAAVAMGGSIYTLIAGCLSFLRMGTTGFTAQAVGRRQGSVLQQILIQGVILAITLAILIGALAIPFSYLILFWTNASGLLHETTIQFFYWRLLGLPATLINFTLIGWYLGTQNARIPLMILITTNVTNIILSIVLVLYLNKGVTGAAQAAIIAEYIGCLYGFLFINKAMSRYTRQWQLSSLKQWSSWKPLLTVNRDIFIRSLTLQSVFLLVAIQGTRLGTDTVAANMLIMNGLIITAYILDGLAHAVEALCGKAIGAQNKQELSQILTVTCGWALFASMLFSLGFILYGHYFINLQTTISAVREQAYLLIPYLALLPLIAVWSYLLDGLFIGATRAKEMRDAMLLAFIISLPIGILLQPLANNGLWITFLIFMAIRGIILGSIAWKLEKTKQWIPL